MRKINEPIFTEIPSSIQMTEAFNFYAENFTWKNSKDFLLAYLQNRNLMVEYKYAKNIIDAELVWVSGFICRMIDNGSKIDESSQIYLDKILFLYGD